jgi:hypothetical protein
MKIAYIAPISELEYTNRSDLHLVLPHLFSEPFGARYRQHYRRRRSQGDYLILDNGADEFGSATIRLPALLGHARRMRAQEVVLPDVQQDGRATVNAVQEACEWLLTEAGRSAYRSAERPRLMIVPQGKSYDEWVDCFSSIFELTLGTVARIDPDSEYETEKDPIVVGVAKNHDKLVLGGVVRLVHTIKSNLKTDIHMLGWPRSPSSMTQIVRMDCVRSVDTARPFVYAMNRQTVTSVHGRHRPYPGRMDNYFRRTIAPSLRPLVLRNIEYYEDQLTHD